MRHRRARRTTARRRIRYFATHRGRANSAKGRENEAKVRKALEALQEEGYIRSFFVSAPNDWHDRIGVDAGLTTVGGAEINFQIKSSDRGVQKHLRKHPEIPCLNVCDCFFVSEFAQLIRTRFKLP